MREYLRDTACNDLLQRVDRNPLNYEIVPVVFLGPCLYGKVSFQLLFLSTHSEAVSVQKIEPICSLRTGDRMNEIL